MNGDFGTGFTSISDYLRANAGTLARESQDIGGMVSGEADAAKSSADSAIAAYGSAVGAGQAGAPGSTGSGPGGAPTQTETQLNQQIQHAYSQASEAEAAKAATKTQGGVQGLLQQQYGVVPDANGGLWQPTSGQTPQQPAPSDTTQQPPTSQPAPAGKTVPGVGYWSGSLPDWLSADAQGTLHNKNATNPAYPWVPPTDFTGNSQFPFVRYPAQQQPPATTPPPQQPPAPPPPVLPPNTPDNARSPYRHELAQFDASLFGGTNLSPGNSPNLTQYLQQGISAAAPPVAAQPPPPPPPPPAGTGTGTGTGAGAGTGQTGGTQASPQLTQALGPNQVKAPNFIPDGVLPNVDHVEAVAPYSVQQTTLDGRNVYAFTVKNGDVQPWDSQNYDSTGGGPNQRAEISYAAGPSSQKGNNPWVVRSGDGAKSYSMSFQFAPGFPMDTAWATLMQFHAQDDNPTGQWGAGGIDVHKGFIDVGVPNGDGSQQLVHVPIQTGQWYNFRYDVNWSSGSDGWIKVYNNGQLLAEWHGATIPQGIYKYLKQGYYRSGSATQPGTVYETPLQVSGYSNATGVSPGSLTSGGVNPGGITGGGNSGGGQQQSSPPPQTPPPAPPPQQGISGLPPRQNTQWDTPGGPYVVSGGVAVPGYGVFSPNVPDWLFWDQGALHNKNASNPTAPWVPSSGSTVAGFQPLSSFLGSEQSGNFTPAQPPPPVAAAPPPPPPPPPPAPAPPATFTNPSNPYSPFAYPSLPNPMLDPIAAGVPYGSTRTFVPAGAANKLSWYLNN